jgi:hypothetical protein
MAGTTKQCTWLGVLLLMIQVVLQVSIMQSQILSAAFMVHLMAIPLPNA